MTKNDLKPRVAPPGLKDMNWSPHPRGRVGSAGVPTQTRPELWRAVPGRNNGKENPRPISITNTIAVACCYEAAAVAAVPEETFNPICNQPSFASSFNLYFPSVLV